jgi:hypothetical protein
MELGLSITWIVVANENIVLESCKGKFRTTLGFTIRHHYHLK